MFALNHSFPIAVQCFREQNNRVVFEAESTSVQPDWEFHSDNFILPVEICPKRLRNDTSDDDDDDDIENCDFGDAVPSFLGSGTKSFAGFSGSGYVIQNGPTFFRQLPGADGGHLRYQFQTQEAGIFRLRLRLKTGGSRSFNDVWVSIPDARNVTGECPVGSNGNTLHLVNATKISTNQKCDWNWDSNVQCQEQFGDTRARFVFSLARGLHNMQILPRSNYVAVDKVVIYRFNSTADIFNDALFTQLPQSPPCS